MQNHSLKSEVSFTIRTPWPAHTATSSKDRWIGAYSIALTILGKLNCLNKKKKELSLETSCG